MATQKFIDIANLQEALEAFLEKTEAAYQAEAYTSAEIQAMLVAAGIVEPT
jgi:hypothetical protein